MSTSAILWAAVGALGTSIVVQGLVLRASFRRQVNAQNSRHLQAQETVNEQVAKSKHQIGKLQSDLAAARLQLKRAGKNTVAAKQAVERELDSDSAPSRPTLPQHGFADTQPQVTQYGSLLML